jgi:hypothetical protein
MARAEQFPHNGKPDEARGAGYKNSHERFSLWLLSP